VSYELNRVLHFSGSIGDRDFLHKALQYLVLSLENQVYYHLADYTNTNLLPRLISRLGRSILSSDCDHELLLEYHPRFVQAYQQCLRDLHCEEHSFSSDDNSLKVAPNLQTVTQMTTQLDFVVSLFWESPYERGLSAAQKQFH